MSAFARFNPFASGPKLPAVRYLTASEAKAIDADLMGEDGAFSLDQLMELAGLSIAQALSLIYPLGPPMAPDENGMKVKRTNERVLVCCGPGNQGGDGLVAARHLYHFGYAPSVFYPKESKGEIFSRLKKQCENLGLPLIAPPPISVSSFPMASDAQEVAFKRAMGNADVIVDCIFGFSYKPPSRAPFTSVLEAFKSIDRPPILSIDLPSGWDVEEGNTNKQFTPEVVLSLTAPKLGIKQYAEEGRPHWLGGRFISAEMDRRYQLNLPGFPGSQQCVNITFVKN